MAMRAGGLMAGGVLLVASWIAWFVSSGPLEAPWRAPASAPGSQADESRPAYRAAAPIPSEVGVPGGAGPLVPIFAELRDGTPLSDFLVGRGGPRTVSVAISELPPGLLTTLLSGGAERGVLLSSAFVRETAGPLSGAPYRGAPLGHVRLPDGGAWIALYVSGVPVDVRRISPGRTFVRFELDAAALHRLLGTPLT